MAAYCHNNVTELKCVSIHAISENLPHSKYGNGPYSQKIHFEMCILVFGVLWHPGSAHLDGLI